MLPGKGKNKGNSFENKIARMLSLWLTGGEDKTQLIPSRLSGGWQDKQWRHAGDLAPNGECGDKFRRHFIVECKHRKTDVWWTLFNAPGENIQGWWEKLCKEASALDLVPMLVVKQNNRSTLVGLPMPLADLIVNDASLEGKPLIRYSSAAVSQSCGLFLLDELLTLWEPADVYDFAVDLGLCREE